jgi:hypothetical protein
MRLMDAGVVGGCDCGVVAERAVVRVTMELSLEGRPLRGWLEPEGGPRSEFVGMIDLVAALEGLQLERSSGQGERASVERDI